MKDNLELSGEETILLLEILRHRLDLMRTQLSQADSVDFKQGLKDQEARLEGIIARLEPLSSSDEARAIASLQLGEHRAERGPIEQIG